MIYCTINDKKAYPDTTQKIKVTYENQFVKDSGSYTYDVQFPMAILENKIIFSNVDRIDVAKKLPKYEDCKLYADNRLIISGKGTVTKIDQDKVYLQIVGGKSRIKYNAKFEKHYIDEINYPVVKLDTGINKTIYQNAGVEMPSMDTFQWLVFVDLSTANYVGQKDVCVMSPVNDETNEIMANRIAVSKFSKIKINGVKYPSGTYSYMSNCAVQPYLTYVLKKVMEYEGYTIERNDIDKDPWNRLVVVSACKSGKIANALPHWTVYKFIDELRKFFNASFIFDEIHKSVKIIATNELMNNDTVSYECEDDFSVEYDEDGLDNISTSNIEYSFDNAVNRDWREYISQSVQKNYVTKEYASMDDLVAAAEKMTEKERKTTIFKQGYDYYIWAELPKGDPDSEDTEVRRTQCGYFNPIIRDMESETFQELNIIPVAIYQRKNQEKNAKFWEVMGDKMGNPWMVVPSVSNEVEKSLEEMSVDDDGEYYYTVQDAMEGSTEETSEESDDSKMPVAFVANNVVNLRDHKAIAYDKKTSDSEDTKYRVPVLYTDWRMYPDYTIRSEIGSLTLEALPYYLGGSEFGGGTVKSTGRFTSTSVDKNNQISFKFCCDDIPDPTRIYTFRNKRYICEKIEIEVSNEGIDKEKTGYFYAIY